MLTFLFYRGGHQAPRTCLVPSHIFPAGCPTATEEPLLSPAPVQKLLLPTASTLPGSTCQGPRSKKTSEV